MALQFKLPDIGEGVAEGEIVQWLVNEGDTVAEHQAVVEVMTDKATVEIPAPAAGTVSKLAAQPGDVVPVGTVIFHLETEGGSSAAPAAKPAQAAGAQQKAAAASGAAAGGGGSAATATATAPEPTPRPAASGEGAGQGGGRTLEFKLPDIGEGVAEGEIVQWLVAAGDSVTEHQPVVEVMTDKATVEIPAPSAGRIGELRAAAGDVVPVGSVIYTLIGAGAAAAAPAADPAPAAPAPSAAPAAASPQPARTNGKVLAVPSARRVARELGVDLGSVPGTGRNGVVRRADVEAFAASGSTAADASAATAPAAAPRAAPAPVSFEPGERETRVPFRGVRRKISEAMVRSVQTAAHFTVVEEVDVTELVRLRAQAKALGAEEGIKVTYMPFIMKACALALAKYPMLNGHLDEGAGEIVQCGYVNLGIAMDTGNGLIVPVIPEVQSKGVLQLAAELAELAERTRAGKVRPEELKGSTFSITNAGNIGGTLATPIINFPDIAIMGVHRLMKRPGVVETPEGDTIEVRQYMNFSCSVDHRLADGADGARFLVHVKRLLETPGLLAL